MSGAAVVGFIAAESAQSVSAEARAMAEALAARFGAATQAVLFYGSCLRPPNPTDPDEVGPGGADQRLMDFYVLADDLLAANGGRRLAALGNRLLPPNVFYVEAPHGAATLRAKVAVMTLAQFAALAEPHERQTYVWGRFSQPTAIVWSRSPDARARLVSALARAVRTMVGAAAPLVDHPGDALALWTAGFAASYASELRPESPQRARQIVMANARRYEEITPLALAAEAIAPDAPPTEAVRAEARRQWRKRGLKGKLLNVLRIAKAAFTFDGGVDYVAWKLRRHSGVDLDPTDWQRRHPLLAAPALVARAWRLGAFRGRP